MTYRFTLILLLPLLLTGLFSCQPQSATETSGNTAASAPQEAVLDSARLAARRAAPEFYVLTPENYKNRVFICDDPYSDVFHTKYDCTVLSECTVTKRNVTLVTAIRDYGRYNCETCSPELAEIFDEELVR